MPRSKKTPPVAAGARDKLVSAAIASIAEKGWKATTTRGIAKRAGVNLALVNYHFGSKKGLLMAAFDTVMEELGSAMSMEELVADPARFLRKSLKLIESSPDDRGMRVVIEATLQAPHDPEVREAMAAVLRDYREQLARALAGGKRPNADCRGRAIALAALLDGVFLHRLIDDDLEPRQVLPALKRLLE